MRPALLLATLAALLLAGPAHAAYYLSQHEAQHNARSFAHNRHSLYATYAECRPKGKTADDGGYHHRWICTYVGRNSYDEQCGGIIQVIGGSRPGIFWTRTYVGLRCFA
jgi:hypothetical protein